MSGCIRWRFLHEPWEMRQSNGNGRSGWIWVSGDEHTAMICTEKLGVRDVIPRNGKWLAWTNGIVNRTS